MRQGLYICLVVSLVALNVAAQTSFTASWNFEGNTNGCVDNPNVSISSAALINVNEAGYPAGVTGDAISVRLWPTTGLDGNKYIEVSLTPQNYRMSITSISFDCNHSTQGPTQLSVRSNQDNFVSDIGVSAVGDNFSNQSYSLGFNNLENTISFRIYAYSAVDNLGTLRLDNLRIGGTVMVVPLPVELSYFKGQIFDNQVNLTWSTIWERDALHFDVQRSSDLKEFATLQTFAATGNTREKSYYLFVDEAPLPGVNYYRLRQVDTDGKFEYSKIISVNFNPNAPRIWVFGNPTSPKQLYIRLQQITPSDLRLLAVNGQLLPMTFQKIGLNDYLFQTNAPAGWYWIVGQYQNQRLSQKVLLIEP
ncbi:MAG: hypothetical protein R2822_16355 [Spirosomataceae bacterium]